MAEIARATWACMPRRDRIVPAAGQKMRLAEIGQEERMVSGARRLGIRKRLLYEDHALLEAARQRIRVPEMRGRDVKEIPHLGHSAHLHGVLERRDGLRDGAPAEASVSVDEIAAIIHLAGDPEDLLTLCHRFRELVNVSAVGHI